MAATPASTSTPLYCRGRLPLFYQNTRNTLTTISSTHYARFNHSDIAIDKSRQSEFLFQGLVDTFIDITSCTATRFTFESLFNCTIQITGTQDCHIQFAYLENCDIILANIIGNTEYQDFGGCFDWSFYPDIDENELSLDGVPYPNITRRFERRVLEPDPLEEDLLQEPIDTRRIRESQQLIEGHRVYQRNEPAGEPHDSNLGSGNISQQNEPDSNLEASSPSQSNEPESNLGTGNVSQNESADSSDDSGLDTVCSMQFPIMMLDKVPGPLVALFSIIGAFVTIKKVYRYIRLLLSLFVIPGTNLRKYGKKGTWAVVTGASDGLGKEYAIQLAQKGFNLLLISRTASKLDTLSSELTTKYAGSAISVTTLAMDFSKNDEGDYAKLKALVDGLDVGILINNVGQSHSIPVPFLQTPKDEVRDIIAINCVATLKVTQIVAPGMVQRKRGLILTMGSFAGWLPTPLLATYSGSKAFLQHWSTSLGGELLGTGVDVELCLSYLVTTAMSKVRKTSMTIPNPRKFVKAALGKIRRSGGAQNMAFTSTPFWGHALMQWWLENTLGIGGQFAVMQNKKMHEDIRKRALRKAERDAKKA